MDRCEASSAIECSRGARPCQGLSLRELAERIVRERDRAALREFHDRRTLFRFMSRPPLLFAEFVAALCRTQWARGLAALSPSALDYAYDLTIDKFANLPPDGSRLQGETPPGPDCRHSFRCFLRALGEWEEQNPDEDPLTEEIAAAGLLQSQVLRQFRLSCLEARRSTTRARSRYAWHVNGRAIGLWMPSRMTGGQRRAWLEANAEDPDPARPGERCRVQAIVDALLGIPQHVPLDEEAEELGVEDPIPAPWPSSTEEKLRARGLPETVADEKAEHIHLQRPAVQALGAPALRRLILRIFDGLFDGCYEEKHLAREFGISRATFSRFAGSRWLRGPSAKPPDLWRNVAHVLASHEALAEAAEQAGIWEEVARLAAAYPLPQMEAVARE